MNIEKRHIIDINNLSGEEYFASIIKEAYSKGLLADSEIEDIQLQCIELLAHKCERYSGGESSSIRVEAAESIMKSNFYTLGLYLKSLTDADAAAKALKGAVVSEMYQKGRKLINAKLNAAKHIYVLAQKNKLVTRNYSYNATLDDDGIGAFFMAYNPDFEAHEVPASIDYQLCNPADGLAGVEFVHKYLESLFLENEFCRNFDPKDIHHLLFGYDAGYKELLINIFGQVLTAALGCSLANRSVSTLYISEEEIQRLYAELSEHSEHSMDNTIRKAAGKVLEELKIDSPSLKSYIGRSLPKITSDILLAIKRGSPYRIFAAPVNPDLKPKIRFDSGTKMDNEDYRKLIHELLSCRYLSDKLGLIKEKVKAFADLEDVLFDAQLNAEEIFSIFDMLEDVELAVLIKNHPFISEVQAVDLPEAEQEFRLQLQRYMNQLAENRKRRILEMVNQLMED